MWLCVLLSLRVWGSRVTRLGVWVHSSSAVYPYFCWFHWSRECDCLHSVSWWTCLHFGGCFVRRLLSEWWYFGYFLNFGPRPLYPVTGVLEPSLYNTACQGERCDPICVRYTRDQLLAISPARLTPDLTSRLRKLDIAFCLPRKRSRRGGKNLKKGRPIDLIAPCVLPVGPQIDLRMPSSVNFNNLITIALQTKPALANDISIALFNARSVNSPEKRTEINTFITDENIQVMFLTETWLRARGDDARCSDLTPAGYSVRSFPRPSRGGGLAVIFHDRYSSRISFTTPFPFDHSSFELARVSLAMTQQTVNFFCVYRPPPSRKNKQTDMAPPSSLATSTCITTTPWTQPFPE